MSRKHYKVNERFFWIMTLLVLSLTLAWLIADYNGYRASCQPGEVQSVTTVEEFQEEIKPVSLGTYKITHYTNSIECCNKTDGITASGAEAKENHTVAADGSISFGTRIIIEGDPTVYTVEDRGGAIKGNRLDVFVGSMEEAINRGVIEREVFVIK